GNPVDSFGCNVFGKISEADRETAGFSLLDALNCKKTDLPVPYPRMRIALDAMFRNQQHLLYRYLPSALCFADRNRSYLHFKLPGSVALTFAPAIMAHILPNHRKQGTY